MVHILIIDDDPDILDIVRMELEENPQWKVDTAQSAIDALHMTGTTRFDIIVSDYMMPRMDGATLLTTIRKQGCTSFIIIYSGRLDEIQERKMKDLGADAILHRRGDPEVEFSALKNHIASVEKKLNKNH